MKTTIEVADRKEAEQIQRGLNAPDVRAFVKMIGALSDLPSDRARARVLRYVKDRIDDDEQARQRRELKRSERSVCPSCHRSFSQMARHMKTKHPEFANQANG